MEGLPVSYSLNSGDNGNNWWGDFIGAAIGVVPPVPLGAWK